MEYFHTLVVEMSVPFAFVAIAIVAGIVAVSIKRAVSVAVRDDKRRIHERDMAASRERVLELEVKKSTALATMDHE